MAQATADELNKVNNNDNDNNDDNNNNKKEEQKQEPKPEPKPLDAANLANLKQLRVQSGALRRYTKELRSYMKELVADKAELEEMRNSNDDEKNDRLRKIEIKQQRQAIEETENVIRDIRPKLVNTWENVDSLIKDLNGCEEHDEELFNNTKQYLEDYENLVND
eukprot:498514_1